MGGPFDGRTSVSPLMLLCRQLAFEQGAFLMVVGTLEALRFTVVNKAWVVVVACGAMQTRISDL